MRYLRTTVIGVLLGAALLYVCAVLSPPRPARAQSTFAPLQCNQFKPFSASANTLLFAANNTTGPTGAALNPQFIYICSLIINNANAAAATVSIVEGTTVTTPCDTNTKAVIGNSTAAGGLALGINGGQNIGGGIGPIAKTQVAGDNVCIFPSAGPISGAISAVQGAY